MRLMAVVTPHLRKAIAVSLAVASLWLIYHGFVIAAFCAKAIGYPAILDTLKAPPGRHIIQIGGVIADELYVEPDAPPVLIVHGVNATGKDSPPLQVMATALAQVGFRTIVPDLPELKRQHVTPADAQLIRELIESTRAEGIVCVSYGCGPALLAAVSSSESDSLRFVMTYGGYFDMRQTLRHIVTAPPTPLSYGKWLYLAANADFAEDARDQDRLRQNSMLRERGESDDLQLLNSLSPAGRATLQLFESRTPEEFDERYRNVPEFFRSRVEQISPSLVAGRIRANLIILHGAQDPCIPPSESVELAEAARKAGRDGTLALIGIPGHTSPLWPPVNLRSIFEIYIPEGWKLWKVARELLSYA